MSDELPLLYRDEHLAAFNKPSGLLVHRSEIDRRETRNAMQMARDQLGQWVYPVHRLDKPTSGVLLFALDSDTARRVSADFAGREVKKDYLAVVRGWAEESGQIDHPLKEIADKYADPRIDPNKAAQAAITNYQRLATAELAVPVGRYASARYSLLLAQPLTGRQRQIRRHFKHIFHPILGDTSHGDGCHNQCFREQFDCQRLLLHAARLRLRHPHSGVPLDLRADLDDTFHRVLNALGWQDIQPLLV
jgi:tRNA pseudouridine65 synthase